jgi:methionyl aminopeptidase
MVQKKSSNPFAEYIAGYSRDGSIPLFKTDAFEEMRKAGRLASHTLDFIAPYVVEGVTGEHLNQLCHDFIQDHKAIPAPLGYNGYPRSICVSINEVVCHGIPNETPLKSGDIVNLDITVILNGWYGDTSRMFTIGEIPNIAQQLIDTTYESMMQGIAMVKPGIRLGDIGFAIQSYAEEKGFSVVRDYCGHGIGHVFHGPPQVLHYGRKGTGQILEPGMFFTIEPMINQGSFETVLLADQWTVRTKDRKLSAQFEHTLAVTDAGFEIFTLS